MKGSAAILSLGTKKS